MANIINFPSGKVGIGTENPQQTLDIAGTLRLSGSTGTGTTLMARNASGDVSAVTIGVGLNLSNNSLTATGGGTGTVSGSGTATQIAFWDGATGTTSSSLASSANLYWDNINGRLGVGTNTPNEVLTVVRNSPSFAESTLGLTLRQTATGTPTQLSFATLPTHSVIQSFQSGASFGNRPLVLQFGGGSVCVGGISTAAARLHVVGTGTGTTTWTAQFHNNSNTSNSLMIRDDGNVAIGNSSPNARLQVHGADTSDTGWTAQFHNSLGNSNSLMIRNDGNVGIGTTGTTARLIIQGTGSSSAATMAVVNSGGTNSLRVLDNGSVLVNLTNASSPITLFEVNSRGRFWGGIELGGFAIARIDGSGNYFKNVTGSNGFGFYNTSGFNGTIGQFFWSEFSTNINPTSGSAEFSVLKLSPTFNLSGTAATTVIGLDYNPVINSIVNGKNYAALFRSGSVGIGTSTPVQTLDVAGTMRLTGSTGTGTTLMARNADGDVSAVTVGSGLNLSNNTLTATGGGTGTVSGSGTATQVAFWGGTTGSTSTALSGSSNLYWDGVNNRLGIGTSTPASTLDIAGTLRIGSTNVFSFASNTITTPTNTNTFIAVGGNRFLHITNSTATQNIINFDGTSRNVGIGIGLAVAGSARLHVVGSGITAAGWTAQFHNSGGTSNSLMIRDDGNVAIGNSSPNARLQVHGADTSNSNWTAQFHNSLGNSNSLMIRNDGRVGMGTNAPTANLDVSGDQNTFGYGDGIRITGFGTTASYRTVLGFYRARGTAASPQATVANDVIGSFSFFGRQASGNYVTTATIRSVQTANHTVSTTVTTGNLEFFTADGTNEAARMILDPNGRLNIGTTTSNNSAILNVVSTTQGFLPPRMTSVERDAIATPATGLQIYNTTLNVMQHYNGTTWVSEAGGSGGTGTLTGSGTATQVAFWGGTTGSTSTALSGSSNLYWDGINNRLGIGTSTPAARLEVSGSDALINNRIVGLGVGNTSTNTFLSTGVGSSFSGGHTVVIGAISLPSITTASANVLIGSNAGNNITTGGSNTYIGRDAGSANQTAIVNFGLGTFALLNHTTGDNNIAIGFDAGRRISTGATMTSSSNGIFIGNDTKPLANGNTNQIIIGQNSVGLGSNTTVIGNTGTTQTHLHGNLTLGSTNAPTARMVVTGADDTSTGWTAQFHNSLGNSNSLMIRNDGNVGVGTSGTTARFVVRASGSSTGSTAMLIQNSGGTTLLRVREDGNVGIGTAEPTNRLYVDGSTYVGSLTVLGGINSITGSIFLASARSIQFGSNTSIIGQDGSSGFIRYTVNNNEIFRATTTSIGIGTTTPAQTLHVAGTMRLTGSTGTGTTLMARNADGDVSAVTLGTGVVLSNNVISVALSPKAETPNGLVNGSNITYTLASTPIANQSVMVFLNGVAQYNGIDYTVSGTTITFGTAPANGSSIFAYYMA